MNNRIIVIGIIALVLVGGGLFVSNQQSQKTEVTKMAQEKTAMQKKPVEEVVMTKDIVLVMNALNNSGQTGKTTLSNMNGKTKVIVEISGGAVGVSQPSHIHMGTSVAPGAIVYPLNPVINEKAETIIDVSLESLGSQSPLMVMVHKSKEEAKIFVSGGDLPAEKKDTSRYVEYSKSVLDQAVDKRRVLYFYATWCPSCKTANEDFMANSNKIPKDVIVIRTNYNDPNTDQEEKDLAKKYGITYQHTFVQIDSTGKEIAKWNGGQTDELTANIK